MNNLYVDDNWKDKEDGSNHSQQEIRRIHLKINRVKAQAHLENSHHKTRT